MLHVWDSFSTTTLGIAMVIVIIRHKWDRNLRLTINSLRLICWFRSTPQTCGLYFHRQKCRYTECWWWPGINRMPWRQCLDDVELVECGAAGGCQPYCVLSVDDPPQNYITSAVSNSINPFFDEQFILYGCTRLYYCSLVYPLVLRSVASLQQSYYLIREQTRSLLFSERCRSWCS